LNGRCDIGAVESAGGNLANTGIQTEQLLLIALALFLAGGGLLALTRRRR
jgi:LPXTG-motif cell wall-anchored protein